MYVIIWAQRMGIGENGGLGRSGRPGEVPGAKIVPKSAKRSVKRRQDGDFVCQHEAKMEPRWPKRERRWPSGEPRQAKREPKWLPGSPLGNYLKYFWSSCSSQMSLIS